jgi:hypothetical protein
MSIKLKIIYWNANSIRSKLTEFYTFLSDENIDIACICETFLKSDQHINAHPDYITYRLDREDRPRGGVMIVIKKLIKHAILPSLQTSLLECLGLSIETSNGSKIEIFSVYLPGGACNSDINKFYINDLRKITKRKTEFFAMGDFNSKHRLWNNARANAPGTQLFNEYLSSNFVIHYPDSPTYYPNDSRRNPSTIDLLLSNSRLGISDLNCIPTDSDHNAISFDILLNDKIEINDKQVMYNYKIANWEKYRRIITKELNPKDLSIDNIHSPSDINIKINEFTKIIQTAQSKCVAVHKNNNCYFVNLTPDIREDIKFRNVLLKRWQRCRCKQTKTYINNLNKSITQRINDIKNMNWQHKLESTQPNSNDLWKTTKYLKNRSRMIGILKNNNSILITAQEKAEAFAEQFASSHDNPLSNHDQNFSNKIYQTVNESMNQTTPIDQTLLPDSDEIKDHIKQLKNSKSPGADRIHNTLIKNLPSVGIKYIKFLITACMIHTYFPDNWKNAKVVPIHKTGKDKKLPSSYRPISLLNTLSKIFEKVLLRRINQHLDSNNILPIEQHGFRQKYSTTRQLCRITDHIKSTYNLNKSSTGLISLDVEKAFDRVWQAGLIYKMIKYKFPINIVKIVSSFLSNRKFYVSVNNTSSKSKTMPFGCPQGACLSPTLYNIYTSDFPKSVNCSLALYADDICFYTSSPYESVISNRLKQYASSIHSYLIKWKININIDKTKAMFFTHRRTLELPPPTIHLFDTNVEWSSSLKYLGIILDKKLIYKQHTDYVTEKTLKMFRILYSLMNRKSKLNTFNKLLIVKMIFRPTFLYASPVFRNMAEIHVKKLQVLQNKLIKHALNVPMFTSTNYIHSATNIPTVKIYIQKTAEKFYNNLQ